MTRSGITYVDPHRVYASKPMRPGLSSGSLDGAEFTKPYWVPSVAAKLSASDSLACGATYTVSFGASSDNGGIIDSRGKTAEGFDTDEYGLTCAYFVPLAKGRVAILGGVYYESFEYELDGVAPVGASLAPLEVELSDDALGWRAGLAYEIPEIAFRTQLLYRSGAEYEATGTSTLPTLGMSGQAMGWGELPQSVELKAQTGIAPGWLAFGAVKWTDWSVMDYLTLRFGGADTRNEYHWRDGWTLTAGIGHVFNDDVSGFAAATWDRGVATGWDLFGDTASVSAGLDVKDRFGGSLRFGGAVLWLASEQETMRGALSASTEQSWGYALSARYKMAF